MRYNNRVLKFIGRGTPKRMPRRKVTVRHGRFAPPRLTETQYYNAGVLTAYGQTEQARAQLGDLFNDVMGAIVPGWDQRPEALKRIVVKPDANRLLQAAQRVAPGAGSQVVTAANKYGFGIYTNTPAGQIEVTPGMAQGMYQGSQWYARAKSAISDVPGWVWVVAGVGGVAVVASIMRK